MLTVRTARISCRGTDRLDITRKSAGPDGIAFAPTWEILRPVLDARKSGDAARYEATREPYARRYTAEMRASFGIAPGHWAWMSLSEDDRDEVVAAIKRGVRPSVDSWSALLARETATLVCYCASPDRCHRRLLAEILVKLGARYDGEAK